MNTLFSSTYTPSAWPRTAKLLKGLFEGNNTLAYQAHEWEFDPLTAGQVHAQSWPGIEAPKTSTSELIYQLVCADSYDYEQAPWDYWLDFYQQARNQSVTVKTQSTDQLEGTRLTIFLC